MRTVQNLVVLLTLMAVSLLSTACGGASFGVSSSSPIGSAPKLEAYLKGKGLSRHDVPMEEAKMLLGEWVRDRDDLKFVEYRDLVPGYKHATVLALKGTQLVGLASSFRSGALQFSTVGTKVESFTARLWQATAGKDAAFEKKLDRGLGMREYMIATFAKGKGKGSWRKDSQDADMKNPRGVIDRVIFRAE